MRSRLFRHMLYASRRIRNFLGRCAQLYATDTCLVYAELISRRQQGIAFAQDVEHRDLVIKLVQNGSDHHRIFQRLFRDETLANPETFPCVLPPVAILDTPHNYSFVAMPL